MKTLTKKQMMKWLTLLLTGCLTLGWAGCSNDTEVEDAAEEAVDTMGDAADDAADAMGDAADDAADAADDATDGY